MRKSAVTTAKKTSILWGLQIWKAFLAMKMKNYLHTLILCPIHKCQTFDRDWQPQGCFLQKNIKHSTLACRYFDKICYLFFGNLVLGSWKGTNKLRQRQREEVCVCVCVCVCMCVCECECVCMSQREREIEIVQKHDVKVFLNNTTTEKETQIEIYRVVYLKRKPRV